MNLDQKLGALSVKISNFFLTSLMTAKMIVKDKAMLVRA